MWPLISVLANELVKAASCEARGVHLKTWSGFEVLVPNATAQSLPAELWLPPSYPLDLLCWNDAFALGFRWPPELAGGVDCPDHLTKRGSLFCMPACSLIPIRAWECLWVSPGEESQCGPQEDEGSIS